MAFINLQGVILAFGGVRLFDAIDLTVEKGEKVALVGRNGSGKSTLLKLISGNVRPDSGAVAIQKGITSAYLDQMVPGEMPGTVAEVVKEELARKVAHGPEDVWKRDQQVAKVISQLSLEGDRFFNSLSAGLKRQVLLARALVDEPDILLLDEPTNHMDIDSIKRLEEMVLRFVGAVIFVTHDRMFLERIATRIVEIDRGKLFDQSCDYETFLARREAARQVEETQNALFDKKLEKEEHWIRGGIKARRTRNEGRVRELQKLREIRRTRKERPGTVKLEAQESERSGMLVIKAENVSFGYGHTPVIHDLSTTIIKGDRVGILGPNGSGKTTLLRLLLGELLPTSGRVRLGTNLQVSYFDQLREQLDEKKTVLENVVEDNQDSVYINGKKRHIIGYLQDFLFSLEQARSYISLLSGGERNRLLLARLFTRPSNLLVMDEPTNDLDMETLELLEDYLMNYEGTVLLVSHDRAFINNVVTSTLAFEGGGVVKEYVGGYDDWLRQRPAEVKSVRAVKNKVEAVPVLAKGRAKFGFRQQKELEALPMTIQALETEQEELYRTMGDPGLYKKDKSEILSKKERLEVVKKVLAESYARWEELEHLKNESVI
jgi:ATP-binding cassette subfamily F protein uup